MIHINEMSMDFEPSRKILPKLYSAMKDYRHPDMSEFELAFLCGAIKKFRPKKILEIGVASGATTSIILQALEDIGTPYEMHSVDLSEECYNVKDKRTGYVAAFAKENNLFNTPLQCALIGSHRFYLGKFLPQVIDEIGGDIDLIILDTVHSVPGEILDFLAALPYLKSNALIVMHDVAVNQQNFRMQDYFSNAALFSAVTAEKFLNFIPVEQVLFRYPNIGAFQINKQTLENIENVFLTLILPWIYFPPAEQVVAYRRLYKRFYPAELCEIFQEAIDMNAYNFYLAQRKQN